MPAVINILLALLETKRTGQGAHLDIAMTDNLFPYLYWAIGSTEFGHPPRPAAELVTAGSPRYNVYPAADGRYVAVAPIEELRDDAADPEATRAAVAARIRTRPAAEWHDAFRRADVPAVLVRDLGEAMADPHFTERGIFAGSVCTTAGLLGALPPRVVPPLRAATDVPDVPLLGSR